jgi:transcriptional regulator with GAF, ATPase, and Fis domain
MTGFSEHIPTPPETYDLHGTHLQERLHSLRPISGSPDDPDLAPLTTPTILVPITDGNRMYGMLLCWDKRQTGRDDDFVDFMSVLGEILGRRAGSQVTSVTCEYHRTQQEAYEELTALSNQVGAVSDLIAPFFKMMKKVAGVEFMSLASLDGSGENMMRYSIGSAGRMLLEKGVSRQTRGTDVHRVYKNGEPLLESQVVDSPENAGQDGLFMSCGMRSKLVLPVKVGTRVVAAITLGHTQAGYFSRSHLHRINRFPDIIASVIHREQTSHKLETREDLMLRLQLMQRHLLDETSVPSYFDDACEILTRRMECTFARISLVDNRQGQLISQACRTIRDTGSDLRHAESVPLSLLPWHRMTLDAKKLMLINQDDPESQMQDQEASSALIPGIKSAMLVPIMLGEDVKGIISIGEARNWKRRSFGATDLIFAKDVAAKCSTALRMKQMAIDVENSRDEMSRMLLSATGEGNGQWRNRIKSPLTSIIGAVELLQTKGKRDEFSTHYHDLILKSANRIKNLAEEETEKAAEVRVEAVPEQVIG